jgi:hypothetical protein
LAKARAASRLGPASTGWSGSDRRIRASGTTSP